MKLSIFSKTLTAFTLATALTACGGGSSDESSASSQAGTGTVTLSGKAATGAALRGMVEAKNAAGKVSSSVAVAEDGSYSIKVPKGAPYMLKATSDDLTDQNGNPLQLFSYSNKSGSVNITPLTTQAVFSASEQANLATIYTNWSQNSSSIGEDEMSDALKRLIANLTAVFNRESIPLNTNIMTEDFDTDGTGIDAVLDRIKILYNCSVSSCTASYQLDGRDFNWNNNINISSINLNNDPNTGADIDVGSGNYSVAINGKIIVQGVELPFDEIILTNVAKPADENQFCSSAETQKYEDVWNSVDECSYSNGQGKLKGRVVVDGQTAIQDVTFRYFQ